MLLCSIVAMLALAAPAPDFSVAVPMSDGVELATDVYLPAGDGPWPAVLTRTPYNKDNDLVIRLGFADRGIAAVVQNVRGTGESEGAWELFGSDGWGGPGKRDGVDTVEWIRRQPWSNGRVGAIGFSGSGIPALMLVAAAPEGLVCAFANATSDNLYETFYPGGAFRLNTAETWPRSKVLLDELLRHPTYDEYWQARDARARAGRADVPVYLTGAWSDLFQRSTVAFFQAVHNNGLPRAQGNCKLVMAPGAHAAPPGQLEFPDRSGVDIDARVGSMLDWFDFWLKDEDNGILEKPRVALFVMGDRDIPAGGANEWLFLDNWPPAGRPLDLYLGESGTLIPERPTVAESSTSYPHDPGNPVPTVGGNNLFPPSGPHDQREVEARADVVVFQTPPLEEALTVIGPVTATLYVSSEGPDADFSVRLCDVYPDGRSMLFLDNLVRAKYRHPTGEAPPLQPGEVYEIVVDLWDACMVFAPGHRIRVAVASSNYPRFDVNPVAAVNRVHHGARYPSRITLNTLDRTTTP